MKTYTKAFFLIIFLLFTGFLCNLVAEDATSAASELVEMPKLRFGLLPAESAVPFIIAKEKGFFASEGLELELTMFNSPLDRNVALQAGKIDGGIADVMTALSFVEAGLAVKITSDINEDFKLLAAPSSGIETIKQLNGKDVSVVPNFALEYIMDRLADKAGITYKLVNIPSIPARFEALLANRISAVVFTEPQSSLLVSRGAKLLGGSKQAGLVAGAVVFRGSVLPEYKAAVQAMYHGLVRAVDYINKAAVSEYAPLVIPYGFPDAISSYLSAKSLYKNAALLSPAVFSDIHAWSKAKGLIRKNYAYADLVETWALPE